MRRGLVLGVVLVILAGLTGLVAAAGAGRAGSSAARTFSDSGAVTAIAADGPRVAIAVRNPAGCDRAIVWTAPTAVAQSYVSKTSCAGVVFHGIAEIAIAGNRVEWVATAGGNLQDMGSHYLDLLVSLLGDCAEVCGEPRDGLEIRAAGVGQHSQRVFVRRLDGRRKLVAMHALGRGHGPSWLLRTANQ